MMFSRKDIEERELRELAPYAIKSAHSKGRKHHEDEHPYRSAFQRDKDRIIHSTAFRRLEYKTQVFVNHEGDYFRTRLTHTMEVAQISRSIARALNLNEDITEAIALSHDLGHTPFGHSGEEALQELMKEHGGFEHNLQALRVVDYLEKRYPGFAGLNLSWEVRESIIKHSSRYDSAPKIVKKDPINNSMPPSLLIKDIFGEFDNKDQSLLEAQVVDLADSIAYDNHDIDDSLKAGIIDESDLRRLELWQIALKRVKDRYPDLDDNEVRIAQTIKTLIDLEATDLIEHTHLMIKENRIKTIEDIRKANKRLVSFSPDLAAKKNELQTFLFENVYQHYRVARMADKAKRFVTDLFIAFIRNPRQLPPEFRRYKVEAELYQIVCDYIAGMTDRYAQDEYKKLFYPYERV